MRPRIQCSMSACLSRDWSSCLRGELVRGTDRVLSSTTLKNTICYMYINTYTYSFMRACVHLTQFTAAETRLSESVRSSVHSIVRLPFDVSIQISRWNVLLFGDFFKVARRLFRDTRLRCNDVRWNYMVTTLLVRTTWLTTYKLISTFMLFPALMI